MLNFFNRNFFERVFVNGTKNTKDAFALMRVSKQEFFNKEINKESEDRLQEKLKSLGYHAKKIFLITDTGSKMWHLTDTVLDILGHAHSLKNGRPLLVVDGLETLHSRLDSYLLMHLKAKCDLRDIDYVFSEAAREE